MNETVVKHRLFASACMIVGVGMASLLGVEWCRPPEVPVKAAEYFRGGGFTPPMPVKAVDEEKEEEEEQ